VLERCEVTTMTIIAQCLREHYFFFVATPSPVSATEPGELLALLSIVRVPLRVPSAVGLKVTLTEHLDLGPIVAPHPFSAMKSPPAPTLSNVIGVVLLLFRSVTLCGLLTALFPNTTLPKLM
jgi:hypothetical protein